MSKTLVVIDGKSVLYRGFYAMGDLATPQGKPTSATYGFAMMGLRVLKEFKPDYVVVAWDKSKTNIRARRQLYPEYKANRKPMPDELREQIPDVKRLCEAFGWPLLEIDDYEADDIMGTLAVQAKAKGIDTILVTSDLDVLQLVNHHTKVCALKRGLTKTVMYDEDKLNEEFGMTPKQFIDYKALKGDPSDNIPGVAGVGEKTASSLIKQYGSLDDIYENLDKIPTATSNKLRDGKDMAYLSRDLIRLSLQVPVEFDDVAADASVSDPAAIDNLFAELSFERLRRQLPKTMRKSAELFNDSNTLTDAKGPIEQVEVKISRTTPSNLKDKDVVFFRLNKSVVVSTNKDSCHVVLASEIKQPLSVIGYHVKEDLKQLSPNSRVAFDVMVAAFLLNPLLRQQKLEDLLREQLGQAIAPLQFNDEMDDDQIKLLVASLWQLHDKYSQQLGKLPKLASIASDIEWPLLPVLARMETRGVKLDTSYLNKMSKDFLGRINEIKAAIFKEAGQEFNINSPQQLQEVLFEKLQISTTGIKRTKTGYSTGASELDKLRHIHPVVDMITQYRELSKLKSTYIDALPKLVDENNRLHTTFTQTVTQTGRLSSLNPNLQNIPVRTEAGRAIRTAFITDDNYTLVQADYSQFELRLAAALSGDKAMIKAFNSGADIHTQTAAELYNVEPVDVSKQQRYNAKAVNFGVMYGMSPHGLSIATGMSREDAKAFIERYFKLRSDLLEYLESLKQQAKTQGYVETLLGRRRPMPDIHSSNFAVRSAAERAAMNMPIQGTEADLMKLAMIEIDKKLDDDCWQILQIHDSILVESPAAKAKAVAKLLKRTMETITPDLEVKLVVDTEIGENWGEL